ncbi:UvrD-helicase domain-containing protein [Haloferula chungangensis]|uniref:DNA 3'-5' helicase II n=1 Tax=Haloferula chungangensis TaxID=1048331 RepID=A0ABW2L5M0_9BACT
MAMMIPDKPPASAKKSVQTMFRLLRKLDDDFRVWLRMEPGEGPGFLLLWRERHAFLLKVADTSQELAERALQPDFLDDDRITAEGLEESAGFRELLDKGDERVVRCLLVFPNVDEGTIDEVERLRSEETGVAFLGLKQRNAEHFGKHLQALAEAAAPEAVLLRLRARFTPESVVGHCPARVPLAMRGADASLPPGFLDVTQESLAKLEVELPRELEIEARKFETRLITGPAGCGKSLVLLHRALLAARLNRGARLLVLTHNRPINGELERRLKAKAGEGSRIEWRTFFSWAGSHSKNWPNRFVSDYQMKERVAKLMQGGDFGNLTAAFVAEEIGYLRDLGVSTLDEYLALERSGRMKGLSGERRRALWDLLERHRDEMKRANESDWHEQALRFRKHARCHPELLRKYEFIFIDEAQFFAKVWFEPVLASLAPGGQLFMAADPTQGFLKRRESWAAAGIDVRGRSNRLGRPYRSTRGILEFARDMVEQRRQLHPEATDDLDPPSDDDLEMVGEAGETPQILHLGPQAALKRLGELVSELRDDSPQLRGSILVLHADSSASWSTANFLRQKLGPDEIANLDDRTPPPTDPFCSVARLNSATGLEAAVVFLLGVDRLLEAEGDPRLDPEARAERAADHTRLLYMAATRAGRRLVIFSERWV